MRFDAAAFGRRVAQTIKEHVGPLRAGQVALEQSTAALVQRINALERQVAAATVKSARIDRAGVLFITLGDGTTQDVGPVVGRDADAAETRALVETEVERRLAAAPAPRSPEAAEFRGLVAEIVEAAVAALPPPRAPEAAEFRGLVAELVDAAVAGLPRPKDGAPGRNADPAETRALVEAEVERRLAALPAPRAPEAAEFRGLVAELVDAAVAGLPRPQDGAPGRNADPAETRALVEAEVERRLAAIEPARDGRGIAGLLIDDAGELVVTLTDGQVLKAGRVKGRDGADLEGLSFASEDGRTFVLEAKVGGRLLKSTVVWPGLVDRGIWREGRYDAGDGVTAKGSYWIAERATDRRPGDEESGWRLAVKRGRDGRPDRPRQTPSTPPAADWRR